MSISRAADDVMRDFVMEVTHVWTVEQIRVLSNWQRIVTDLRYRP